MADLSPEEDRRLAAWVADVLTAADPNRKMFELVEICRHEENAELACALFEGVVWRVEITNYWVYAIIAGFYRALNRLDAAFLLSALADRMDPRSSGSYHMCDTMFNFFRARGRAAEAVDVFTAFAERFPDRAIAPPWQLLPLARKAGRDLSGLFGNAQQTADQSLRQTDHVFEPTTWPGWTCRVYGGRRVIAIERLAGVRAIPPISVGYLKNAQILISHHAAVVLDANGGLHDDLSLHDFPMLLKRHIDRLEADSTSVEQIELDAAVLIGDRFPATNLCHFLLDHVTRLHVYERAGVDIAAVTVIDATNAAAFQRMILSKIGVTRFLSTDRVARVRVARLWVSSNCRELQHPAHFGSDWAIAYLRDRLIPTPPAGGRRLYISRSDAGKRRVTNEADVVALLSRHGFEVIVPGALDYDAQINAFAAASHVVGPHGAGLTNIVFCRSGTKVLEVFHPRYGTAAYAILARNGGLDYAALVAWDGHSSAAEFNDAVSAPGGGDIDRDIRIDLADLEGWLRDVTEDGR